MPTENKKVKKKPKRNILNYIHTTPEEFKNATITGHCGFVFEENSEREIT